ncbi:uncharacterized protein OCT59_020181 [Rhizophagus irregularis]|uniref:uncharacterized protein n=1 Tax=Rhizophagus irregularis TaxID=588596 RepID=UPI003326ADAF|nr:hypothetical protein OCT59_020181 [Rhizophagus irregularis]
MESELDLLREENARLMAKITGLKFEKAELEARNAKLIERVAKLEEKQLESVSLQKFVISVHRTKTRIDYNSIRWVEHKIQNDHVKESVELLPKNRGCATKAPGETLQLRVIVSVTTDETGVRMKNNEYSRLLGGK